MFKLKKKKVPPVNSEVLVDLKNIKSPALPLSKFMQVPSGYTTQGLLKFCMGQNFASSIYVYICIQSYFEIDLDLKIKLKSTKKQFGIVFNPLNLKKKN